MGKDSIMTEAIIVAIVTTLGVVLSNLISSSKIQTVIETKLEMYMKNTDEKLKDVKEQLKKLEDKQDKHNKVIERTYALEGRMTEAEHDIRDLKAR